MSWMQYLLPILLSAFTGWFVIWISIKLLFRPYKPISLGGIKIHGIIPASQQHIAEKIGLLVSTELFSFSALQEKATGPENFIKLKPEIEIHIDSFLRERLKVTFPMLSMLIGDKTINQLKGAFMLELESMFPVLIKSYLQNLENEFDIAKLVTQKIAGFSISKTEELIYRSAYKQIIKIQVSGTVIGLLIGVIHVILNTLLYS